MFEANIQKNPRARTSGRELFFYGGEVRADYRGGKRENESVNFRPDFKRCAKSLQKAASAWGASFKLCPPFPRND